MGDSSIFFTLSHSLRMQAWGRGGGGEVLLLAFVLMGLGEGASLSYKDILFAHWKGKKTLSSKHVDWFVLALGPTPTPSAVWG